MTIDFNPTADFETITDGLAAVTLRSRSGPNTPAEKALRRAITQKEAAKSDGKYSTSDVMFHLSRAEITTQPALGSWILDDDGSWRILEVARETLGARWRCITRSGHGVPLVYVVDDDADIRFCIASLVRSVGVNVEALASGKELLDRANPAAPGCLVLDVRMPGISGMELQRELGKRGFPLPIIFITAHAEIAHATTAMRCGAFDFIQKPFSAQGLLQRIQQALTQDVERHRQSRDRQLTLERIGTLTERELQVMTLAAEGATTKTIAEQLSLSPKTIENHRTRLLAKIGVDNSTQLAHLLIKAYHPAIAVRPE